MKYSEEEEDSLKHPKKGSYEHGTTHSLEL